MCHAHDAHPPVLPAELQLARIAGGAGAELLELTSADGTAFSAAFAQSDRGSEPGVVVLPDVRGLYPFYSELAERFAQAGHHAIALDYFGRTAGLGPRGEDFDYPPHIADTQVEQIYADIAAVKEQLEQRAGTAKAVTVGFCFGGTQSFLASTNPDLGLAGAVVFYGGLRPSRPNVPSPIERAHDARCPVLGLFGGDDPGITPEHISAFEEGLGKSGQEYEVITYPGAPHSFFDRSFAEHAEACDDAWRRVLGFLDRVGTSR
jgi:carboxymethylenebutenolidase